MEEKNRRHTPEEISERKNLMADIFQKDAQIYDLQSEKIELMQKLYDQEMKMYGRMSKIADQIFEVQHCEVVNGRVRQMSESEWKENSEPENASQRTDGKSTVHGKLSYYKNIEKQQTDSRSKEAVKRETPELM